IMFVEILPNTTGPIIVEATARFAYSIMMVASLGFLGVGLQPPTPDWGMMVIENKEIITQAPWTVIFPALAIASLVIAISIFSDFVSKVLIHE
ncbi:MAG: ABC transporter permease subunit, partial [Spirochaetales bacterium]|nr:ABC transporter permease subunit [Spirochaetales bacterium]